MTGLDPDRPCSLFRDEVFADVLGVVRLPAPLNEQAGFSVGVPQLLWGAYPGSTPEAIGSGVGIVNNTLMLPRPEQGALRAAFRSPLKPFYTATHRTRGPVFRAYVDWAASSDDPRRIASIVLPALRA